MFIYIYNVCVCVFVYKHIYNVCVCVFVCVCVCAQQEGRHTDAEASGALQMTRMQKCGRSTPKNLKTICWFETKNRVFPQVWITNYKHTHTGKFKNRVAGFAAQVCECWKWDQQLDSSARGIKRWAGVCVLWAAGGGGSRRRGHICKKWNVSACFDKWLGSLVFSFFPPFFLFLDKKNLKIADVQKRSADVEMKLKAKAEALEKDLGQKGDDLLRLRGYMHTCVCA